MKGIPQHSSAWDRPPASRSASLGRWGQQGRVGSRWAATSSPVWREHLWFWDLTSSACPPLSAKAPELLAGRAEGGISAFIGIFGETALLAAQDSEGQTCHTCSAGETVLQPWARESASHDGDLQPGLCCCMSHGCSVDYAGRKWEGERN